MTPKGQVGLPEEQRGWFNQTALNPVILDSVRENALAFCPPFPVEANSIDQDRLGTIEAQVEKAFLIWNARRGPSSPSISYLGWRSCRLQVAACVVKTFEHLDSKTKMYVPSSSV